MSNEALKDYDIGGNDSPKEKDDENDNGNDDIEETDIVIKKHIRRHSGSFSADLAGIQEVSHPNFEKFVRDNNNRHTPELEEGLNNERIETDDNVEWNIGKCKCTKSLVTFGINVCFSSVLVGFCIYQLCRPNITPGLRTLYTSTLSGVISLYTPSPFQSRKK